MLQSKHDTLSERYTNSFDIFLRTTQGSRGAPLTWSRFAALLTRLTQSVTDTTTTRINTYVDDTIVIACGTEAELDVKFAMILAIWGALGLPLSLEKAVRGKVVTWTSATFTPEPGCVTVQVKQAIIDDTKALVLEALTKNLFSIKKLRTLTGKLTHIASLVMILEPFLSELYAAQTQSKGKPPPGCIWTKQVELVLQWVQAFLDETPGKLERRYYLSAYLQSSMQISLELDASPWGLGGVLLENGVPTSWFASPMSTEELLLLDIKLGDAAAQQTVEALAALVALRGWHERWRDFRAVVRVRSDSVSALVLALKLKTAGRAPGIIAREMALDIAAASYTPDVAEHVPGIHNTIPDALSRKYQPGQRFILPDILSNVPELKLGIRDRAYYKSLGKPPT
jgi:hypothetical protein